jgi:outer membrane lipase/esterase
MIHFSVQRLIGLCALALASLLVGCGGSSSTVNPLVATRVIAFGDAFSDVGDGSATFTTRNGRYTINGATSSGIATITTPTTVAETLANFYGLWGTAPVARKMVSGSYPAITMPTTGVVSYAVGNSMINPSASMLIGDTVTYRDGLGGTDATLGTQITQFLADGGPKENDLIVITAGTRDLLSLAVRYLGNTGATTKLADGTTPWTPPTGLVDKLGGGLGNADVYSRLDSTTTELVTQIAKLIDAGAKHVVVLEPMNLSRTPWGLSLDAASVTFLRSLSYDTDTSCTSGNNQNSLHCKLTIALSNKYPPTVYGQKLLAVDLAQYINLLSGTTSTGSINTYTSYFSQLPTTPACAVTTPGTTPVLSGSYDASSLSSTWTSGCDADTTVWSAIATYPFTGFMFADNLNLTPQGNALLANYIYSSNMYRAAWR